MTRMARKLKKKVRIILISTLLALPVCVFGVFYFGTPEPPEKEMDKARLAIAEARRTIEKDFLPPSPFEAESLYDSAMYCWKVENERFILSRDYARARAYAIRSEQQALISPTIAKRNTSDFVGSLQQDLAAVKRDTAQIELLYSRLPLPARPSSVAAGWGMASSETAPTASRKVTRSMTMTPTTPISTYSKPASIGAITPASGWATSLMPLARSR